MPAKHFFFEWGAMALLLLLVIAISSATQGIAVGHGTQFGDGIHYLQTALQYINNEPIAGTSPFVYRQFTAWLAAHIAGSEDNLMDAFHTLSMMSGVIITFLTLMLMRPFIGDWRLRLALASLIPLAWFLPMRASFWMPISTDPTGIMISTLMLVLCQRLRQAQNSPATIIALMTAAAFIGVLSRSALLPFALMLPLCAAFSPQAATMTDKAMEKIKQLRPLMLLPLVAGVIAFVIVRANAEVSWVFRGNLFSETAYGSLLIHLHYLYSVSLLQQLQEIYTHWGPLLVLLLWRWRAVARFLADHWHILLFLAINAVYAVSSDGWFFSFAFPAYLLLLGIVMQDNAALLWRKKWLLAVLVLAQLVTLRVFWGMPVEFPASPLEDAGPIDAWVILTPFTSNFNYWNILPLTNHHFYGHLIVTQHLFLTLLALFFLADFRKRAGD